MVDVDRRPTGLSPSHAAGLRRLSNRAASAPSTPAPCTPSIAGESLLSAVKSSGLPLLPALSSSEIALAEAILGLPLPPDLRSLLSLTLPFPLWRPLPRLLSALRLPLAATSLHLSRLPSSPLLSPPPPLIPLLPRFYLPALPSLAGNPVFLIDDRKISLFALDLPDFFHRLTSPHRSHFPSRRSPRWIEFWSDAAAADRRRRSSASPDEFLEIRPSKLPNWVGDYLCRIGSVLRDGGWEESDVTEMVHVADAAIVDGYDGRVALEKLVLKADRCSDSLRRAGWASDDVSDALGFDYTPRSVRRRSVTLPPGVAAKIGKLAESVSRS
ncbi:hypothetical protein J5N97_017966 [Dioscorea zingiberensis]|uniref:Uncharacterized protein n=1 Tax=Dioscorea zingiberensis TaxID=325984 RepID=A0A9D5CME0_9LILI|nr:hypothetical protein J5N97_017966 [Dioscorea zingiberensis]